MANTLTNEKLKCKAKLITMQMIFKMGLGGLIYM